MTPIALDRITETCRSGIFIFSEMAARKPALPPPRTRIRWIIALPRAKACSRHTPCDVTAHGVCLLLKETTADAVVGVPGSPARADQDKGKRRHVERQVAVG